MKYLVALGEIELDDDTYISPGSYACYIDEKVKKWEDAAGGNHEDVYAQKIKGSFTFNSPSQLELDFFMSAYRSAKVSHNTMDKRIRMTVFIPSENVHKNIIANATMPRPVIDYIDPIENEKYYTDIEFKFEEC